MSVNVREAEPDDLAEILRLCQEKSFPDSIFLPASRLKELHLKLLREHFPKLRLKAVKAGFRVLVAREASAVIGFIVLLLKTVESITQEDQTVIFNYVSPSFDILRLLVERAQEVSRAAGDEYQVVHLVEPSKRDHIWFYRLGFRAELNRPVKFIPPGHRGAASPLYVVRPARNEEHLFIIRVNAEYSASYRPTGRGTDLDLVRASFLASYINLQMKSKGWFYLILEDARRSEPMGYVILVEQQLPMVEHRAFYNYDVAVAPEFQGRGLSLYLCGAAETLVGDLGGGFLFGDTCPDNLAVVNGDRHLGYAVDSKRWGLKISRCAAPMLQFCD